MQKSLDSIMSNSLKAAFGKSKAGSETKTSTGTETSTGASNPFSNLLERVMQKNQPKMQATESNPSSKLDRKASQETQAKEPTANSKQENTQETSQTNQPEPEFTNAEPTQTAQDSAIPTSNESSETGSDAQTIDLAPSSPDLNANINLLLSLQQPMTLGLYQPTPTNTADANDTETFSSIESNPLESNAQSVLAGNPTATLPKLATLTGAQAAFSLPLQNIEPLSASTPQTTDLSPDLPNADTLPLSQSSEASSQGLANNLDNGQAALPGTVFGSEITMQASSSAGAIEMSQTITLSNGPISLEALSGQLEMPTTEMMQNTTSEIPLLQQAELGFGLSTDKPSHSTETSTHSLPPLETTFASLLESTETPSQFVSDISHDIEIDARPSEGPIEFETLPTEMPTMDAGALTDLSQATTTQNINGSSNASATSDKNPIAQFTSSAQTPAEQVAEGTIYSIKQGQRELIIRLNPDNLGEVRINLLRHGDNSLSARLIASTPESHDLLKSQLDSLKQNLESQGIQVERLNVIMAGSVDTQNQSGQSQHHTGQQQPDNTNNPQQQASGQGQPDGQTFAQMAGQYSQQKHNANPNHHSTFQTHNNPTTDVPTDGATKPENQARHHANGNISILV